MKKIWMLLGATLLTLPTTGWSGRKCGEHRDLSTAFLYLSSTAPSSPSQTITHDSPDPRELPRPQSARDPRPAALRLNPIFSQSMVNLNDYPPHPKPLKPGLEQLDPDEKRAIRGARKAKKQKIKARRTKSTPAENTNIPKGVRE